MVMLVKLKRDWFGPGGTLYRTDQGLAELDEKLRHELPSDAVIVEYKATGGLPSKGPRPLPGFGAKPLHEQVLDQIPYAAPLHMQTPAGEMPDAEGLHPEKSPPDPERVEMAEKAMEREEALVEERRQEKLAEMKASVKEQLAVAKKMEQEVQKSAGVTAPKKG